MISAFSTLRKVPFYKIEQHISRCQTKWKETKNRLLRPTFGLKAKTKWKQPDTDDLVSKIIIRQVKLNFKRRHWVNIRHNLEARNWHLPINCHCRDRWNFPRIGGKQTGRQHGRRWPTKSCGKIGCLQYCCPAWRPTSGCLVIAQRARSTTSDSRASNNYFGVSACRSSGLWRHHGRSLANEQLSSLDCSSRRRHYWRLECWD